MTRSLTRRAAVATAAVGAALVLSACGDTGVGLAARIGDRRIASSDVADRVERGFETGMVDRQLDGPSLQRQWLSQLVKLEAHHEAARRLGVRPSDEELAKRVDSFIEGNGGLQPVEASLATRGVAPRDVRPVVESLVLRQLIEEAVVRDVPTPDAMLRAEYDKRLVDFDRARAAHINVKDKALADRIVAELRRGGDFAKLAKDHSTDVRTAPNGGVLNVFGNGKGEYGDALVKAVFSAKTGALLGPLPVPGGFEIVKVIERVTVTFEQARDTIRATLLSEQRRKRADDYVAQVTQEMGISVNPRFGRWDTRLQRVEPGNDELSTPAPEDEQVRQQVPQGGQPGQPGGPAPGQ